MSLRVLDNSGRTNKRELITALADELKKVKARAALLEEQVEDAESKLDEKYSSLEAAESQFKSQREQNASLIFSLRRQVASLRSELESSAILEEGEAKQYLDLLESPNSLKLKGRRVVPSIDQTTTMAEESRDTMTAKERIALRLDRIAAELDSPPPPLLNPDTTDAGKQGFSSDDTTSASEETLVRPGPNNKPSSSSTTRLATNGSATIAHRRQKSATTGVGGSLLKLFTKRTGKDD